MADYSYKACMESVVDYIETFGQDPIRMLGEYTLRAQQDIFFNKTMLTALNDYIKEHNIKWNDGRKF